MTTEYVTRDQDFAERPVGAPFRCGICREVEDPDNDVWHYISACEHVVRGDETHSPDEENPNPGSVEVEYDQGKPDERGTHSCFEDDCDLVDMCGDCWSNL